MYTPHSAPAVAPYGGKRTGIVCVHGAVSIVCVTVLLPHFRKQMLRPRGGRLWSCEGHCTLRACALLLVFFPCAPSFLDDPGLSSDSKAPDMPIILRQGPEFIRNRTNTAEEHTAVYHTVQTSTTHSFSCPHSSFSTALRVVPSSLVYT